MVMNKNTYSGLALAACLSLASISALAETAPPYEPPAHGEGFVTKPEAYVQPSELQREQEGYSEEIITGPETDMQPSEAERQREERKREMVTEPETDMQPSEAERQQMERRAIAQ
jgi:Spy/CpxP family protein refolding chaperone